MQRNGKSEGRMKVAIATIMNEYCFFSYGWTNSKDEPSGDSSWHARCPKLMMLPR